MKPSRVSAVFAPLPEGWKKGADKVAEQRRHARRALHAAASFAGANIDALAQDERGAPIPSNGWHWSLSHCSSYVAGCVHRSPVGIDVEDRSDVRAEVVERVLSPAETALFERRGEPGFLRAWTAKEAFLKEIGLGIAGLSRCRIVAVPNERKLVLEYEDQRREIWQYSYPSVTVAVSTRDDDDEIMCLALKHVLKLADGEREPWS